jgi:hypothetical protein
MNFTCQNCNSLVVILPGDRPPPWCSKCGADFKPADHRFVVLTESREATALVVADSKPADASKPRRKTATTADEAAPEPAPADSADATQLARFLMVGAVACLVAALLLAGEGWTFARNARTVSGQVAVLWKSDPLAFATYRSELVIEYEVNGARHHLPAGRREEGERVSVMFQPNEPENARVVTAVGVYQWPLLLGAAGLMLLVSALVAANMTPGAPDKPAAPEAPREPDA